MRRVRQRMGAYRHDLLVAMRVVNKVELEMLTAEWESWLAGETRRCEQVRELLAVKGGWGGEQQGGGGGGEKVQSVIQGEESGGGGGGGGGETQRRAALREWFSEYCTSCAAEERTALQRMGTTF